MKVRLGYIDYLNCLPVYYGLERGMVPLDVEVHRGTPTQLNRMFLQGELDITPISSIEYGRNFRECVILPGLSVSADGRVGSILLFGRRPLAELDGAAISLTGSSATSVVLLKILLRQHYGLRATYVTHPPDLNQMLEQADAALLIGDDALLAAQARPDLSVTDLGRAWKDFTGRTMVYALWVMHRDFAERCPDAVARVASLLRASQGWGFENRAGLVAEALRRRNLPRPVIEDYFNLIRYRFDAPEREGLAEYYRQAHLIGELPEIAEIRIFGETEAARRAAGES